MNPKSNFRILQVSILFLIGISISLISCRNQKNDAVVYDLRCEYLTNPLGIGTIEPGFRWKTKSDINGTQQTAFQVLVASDSTLLNEKSADLWNSGKINSSSGVLIPYNGKELNSRSVGYWKVRMWNEKGEISKWSCTANFTVGLLHPKDWNSEYIGLPEINEIPESPLLRKTFTLSTPGQKLLLYVNSLGYHEIYINGKKVGEDVLSPAVSQFNKRSLVVTYDVTAYMTAGENDLVIWLGRGWYSMGLPGVVNKGPLVKAQLEQLDSGKWNIIEATNKSWKGRMSEYSLIGDWRSGRYGGERVDGALVIKDWSTENLNRLSWAPVSIIEVPEHQVSSQMVEPNRILETIDPDTIYTISENTYLVDMGKNLTGWVQVNFPSLQKGQEILMEYYDNINFDGELVKLGQKDIYIASGNGQETFQNKFNYHGFRYVKISNLPEKPAKESISAFLIQTDFKMSSGFECSDPEMNQIHDMIYYTLRCLSLGGYLVDCPQIERLGYGGDGNASTETAQIMFGLAPLYNNWLQAWGDCIREDGGMPHTAPNPYPAGGGPYWTGFIISATWNTYLNYGDSRILKKYYPEMKLWLSYVEKYSATGILKKWPDTDYRGWYLGDWASPEGINEKSESSVDLVNNSFVVRCYDYMQKIAKVLDEPDDAQLYALKSSELKKQVHQTFFNNERNSYADGNQIDLTYPLLAEIVPDSLIQKVKKSLFYEVEENRKGHVACGLVGIPVFTEWATLEQEVELVYSMLKKKDYPGYLYMIDNGATTTWENWDGSRSCIHNCFNGIGSWFYQAVGGIQMDHEFPAYQQIIIQPQIPDGITWAKTTQETPSGIVGVNWKLQANKFNMQLDIPVGVEAKVIIPDGISNYILGEKYFKLRKGESTVKLKSGNYSMSYKIEKQLP